MFLLYINLDILIYVLFISSGSFVRSFYTLYTIYSTTISYTYLYIYLSLFLSIYLNIDVYLCACLSVCTPFLIIFSRVFRKCSNMIRVYPIILVIHTYCYITRLYADEPLYYYLDLLYFRYGLQFRLKDRTSSYFVICIPKTEPEMYRNSKHSSK